jgi:GTP-binding protein
MRFVDEADILVRGGKGGDGLVSFRREKFVPKGGPNGGDGGKGGNVIMKASSQMRTLLDFKYKRHYKAQDGRRGGPNCRTGKTGSDSILLVPVGTVVKDENGEIIADLEKDGDLVVVARGGGGGYGNAHFATPWRQAPIYAQKGKQGEARKIFLELKLLADVAIVGLPNAGKSSLLNRISSAKAKVADYPFTTLVPNLGVVQLKDGTTFTVADLPGLVEGASGGAGLGMKFLRHCERAPLLVHLVDVGCAKDPLADLRAVENELKTYGNDLLERRKFIVANKVDMPGSSKWIEILREESTTQGLAFFAISARTGFGVDQLVLVMASFVLDQRKNDI